MLHLQYNLGSQSPSEQNYTKASLIVNCTQEEACQRIKFSIDTQESQIADRRRFCLPFFVVVYIVFFNGKRRLSCILKQEFKKYGLFQRAMQQGEKR